MLGRVVVVRPIDQRRDAAVERLERADVVDDIHVVGRVKFAHYASDAAEMLGEAPIGGGVAEQAR